MQRVASGVSCGGISGIAVGVQFSTCTQQMERTLLLDVLLACADHAYSLHTLLDSAVSAALLRQHHRPPTLHTTTRPLTLHTTTLPLPLGTALESFSFFILAEAHRCPHSKRPSANPISVCTPPHSSNAPANLLSTLHRPALHHHHHHASPRQDYQSGHGTKRTLIHLLLPL